VSGSSATAAFARAGLAEAPVSVPYTWRRSLAEHPLDDLLGRLERERVHADRAYNDALTAVDAAIQTAPNLPDGPRPYDDVRVRELNDAWKILGDEPPPHHRTLTGRLRAFIWRLVGPPLQAQERFNAALVDHLNRNVAAHHELQQATAAVIDAAGREFDALARFESLLVQCLQTVTPYLDTKVRRAGGDELRDRVSLAEQRILALKRDLDRRAAREPDVPPRRESSAAAPAAAAPAGDPGVFGTRVDSLTYVGFEDRFRGSQDAIRARLDDYVPIFAGASNVVDVGCGRGELLGLLQQHGIRARGVDTNDAMVELCRARGFEVERDDALRFLERQPDASLGGLIAIQVVEHFDPAYLLRFLETAHHKLRAGAPLVLETINAACWMAFFETYLRDVTHRQALHPDTLRFLVQTSGFANVDVRFREPVRDGDRLERLPPAEADAVVAQRPELGALVAAINAHADKLNARLFSSMDYAVVARR
jgi:SAM-dependent methyltransferase